MQSYILYQRAGGVVEAAKPTAAELKRARGFQTTSKLNLIPNDLNIDGFADHTIENLKSLMGSAVEDGHVVFAPGTAADKTKPSGDVAVTHEFTSFYADLAKWLNDPAHFAKNISITRIPVYGLGWVCGPGWSDPLFGFFPQSFCQPYIVLVGYATKVDGVSLSALAAAAWIELFLTGEKGPMKQDMWNLSRVTRSVLGVHLFGFNEDGEQGEHNLDFVKDAVEQRIFFAIYRRELVSCPINKCDSEWAQSPTARRSPQGISGILPRAATEPSARRREGHPRKNVGRRLCPLPEGAHEKGCGRVASLGNTAKYCLRNAPCHSPSPAR